jgi:1-acyl-sn-glycerol-3-phosphate acyltransferase
VAFNGAEPVAERTLKAFQERFGPHGFRQESMKPVYGLAESSVGLTFPPLERPPILDRIKRDAFEEEGEARPAGEDDTQARVFVACGQALPGHDIRVVDDNGRPLPDRRQGSLQFRGPSCTRGYFNNPEATSKLMEDGWLNSGDLAYLDEGELYLTGRVKDMIIRGGRNYYPYELEQAVSAIPGVRRNNVAVFASPDPAGGPERLVVVAETRETDKGERERIREAIVEASVSLMDSAPDVISLQPPQAIPKTSSGKIRRPACRELFESGKLGQEIGMVRQLLHLLAGGFRPLALRALKSMRRGLFALWAWLAGLLLVVPSACLIAGIPGKRWRAGFARRVARLMFLSWGMSLTVRGRDNLPTGSSVLVANHASYLDGAILRAGLPGPLCFVAKRELAGTLAGFLLRRVGAVWVDRSNHRKGLADLDYAMGHLDQGERLMFFPEGTLSAAPGLRDFRIGAFMAAVRKQVPVVPVVIRGSRRALPGNSLLPRPARLIVEVGEPLWAEGDDWDAAIGLRDRTRAWVLAHCGEADIAHGDGGLIGDARQGRL